MLKKRDVDDDGDDDVEVRTTELSQNCATATLSTERNSSSAERCGGVGNRRSTQYLSTVPFGFSAPSQTSILSNRVYKLYNYLVTGKMN